MTARTYSCAVGLKAAQTELMESSQERMRRWVAVAESMMRPSEDAFACELRIVALLESSVRQGCHDELQLTHEQLHRQLE